MYKGPSKLQLQKLYIQIFKKERIEDLLGTGNKELRCYAETFK